MSDLDLLPKSRQRYIRRANIPVRFQDLDLGDLSIDSDTEMLCREVVARLATSQEPVGRGIILSGRPGRGKSTIAVATLLGALKEVPRSVLGHTFDGDAYRPGYYLTYAEMIRTYQKSWKPDETDAYDLIQALYCAETKYTWLNTKVLVLDDLGKEHTGPSGFTVAALHDLLRSRYDKAAPTIITTNLDFDEFGSTYGEAMESFIHEAFDLVTVGGKDRRR